MAVNNQKTEEENVISITDIDLPTIDNEYSFVKTSNKTDSEPYSFVKTQDKKEKKYGDDFFSNFAEGFVAGGRSLIGNFNYLLGNLQTNPIVKYDMEKWADEVIENSPESDGSVGQWFGNLLPSVIPTGIAVGLSFVPGAQPLAATVGNIGITGLALSSAGAGMKRYDEDKRSAGLDPNKNQGERFAIATTYAAAEAIFERLALNKFLPKQLRKNFDDIGGKFTIGGNKIDEKVANRVVADYIKKKPNMIRRVAGASTYEGVTEAFTSLSQDLANTYFLENKPTFEDYISNLVDSFLGGAVMGGGLGRASFLSQDINTKRRREEAGDVYITEIDGKPFEIIGKSSDKSSKVNLLSPSGEFKTVNETEIGEVFSFSNKQFDNILSAKDYEGIIQDEIYVINKNLELENDIKTYEEIEKFADKNGGAIDKDGVKNYNVITIDNKKFVVTRSDTKTPNLMYGFSLDTFLEQGENTPIIPLKKDLADSKVQSWKQGQMKSVIQSIQKENVKNEVDIDNPVQGQSIEIEGVKFDVLGTRNGNVSLLSKDGEDRVMTKVEFDQIFQSQNKKPDKKKKGVDDIPINEDGTITKKISEQNKDLPVFTVGRAKYKASQMDDASQITLGKVFTIEETANKTAETLGKNYGNLDFEVVNETDTSDIMAKNKFIIKAKPKGQKVDPFKAVKDKAKEIQAKEKIFSPAAEDVLKAIETNQGKEQADAFKKEYDRLVDNLIQERQKKQSETQKKAKSKVNETDNRKAFADSNVDDKNLNILRKSIRAKSKGKNSEGEQIESMTIQVLDDISRGETSGEFVDPIYFDELMSEMSYGEVADMLVQDKMFTTKVQAIDYLNTLVDFGRSTPKKITPKRTIKKKTVKATITKKGNLKKSKKIDDELPFLKTDEEIDNHFSKQINPLLDLDVRRVESVAKRLVGTWKNAPKIKVVQSYFDIKPNTAMNHGIDKGTNAYYDPINDEVVFIAEQFTGRPNSKIERALYHETVGHRGLKKLLEGDGDKNEFNNLMDNTFNDILLKQKDDLTNKISFVYFHKPLDENLLYDPSIDYVQSNKPNGQPLSLQETRELAEEYIAHKVEDAKFNRGTLNILDLFKRSINKITGNPITLNNNDIRKIIQSATRFVQSGNKLYNKNLIRYSLSNKHGVPNGKYEVDKNDSNNFINRVNQSRNISRGDDIDNHVYRPELNRTVKKINQDDFNLIIKGSVVEPVLYDVLTTGDASIYNPVFDFSTDMKGLKGGPNNLFLKENIKNNVVASFTDINKLISTIEQLKNKKVDYLTYVLTGTGNNLVANLDFRKAMFGEGGFTQKIMDNKAPKVEGEKVYHGSPTNITGNTIKRGSGEAIFVTPQKEYASFYMGTSGDGTITELTLTKNKISKLFDLRNPKHVEKLKEGFIKNNEQLEVEYDSKESALKDYDNAIKYMRESSREGLNDWAAGGDFMAQMENAGFEGAIFSEEPGAISYALFDKEIKISGIDFIEFRDDFINRARGLEKIDKTLDDLAKTNTIGQFGDAIINMAFDKFQLIADKIFPKTVGTPSVNIMQTKYGFPTKDGVIGSLADPMFSNAQGGDIVSISKPDLNSIYVNQSEYDSKTKRSFNKYEDMGYTVNVLPKEAEHPSYPYAIGGEAIGVLNQFQNFADVYSKLDKEGNIEAIPKDSTNPNYYLRRSGKLIDKFNVYKKTNRGPSEDPFVTKKISVAPIRYFDEYIKDFVKGKDVKASDVADIINKRDFNSYRKSIVDTSALFGLKVSNVTNNIELDNQEFLFSNNVDVTGTKEDIKAFAVAMATFKDQKKKVIVSEVKEGSTNTDLELFLNKGIDIDKFMDSAKKNGIIDGKFDINLNKFTIFGVGLEIDSNIQNFLNEQKNNVKKGQYKEVESEFIQENEYKRILKRYGIQKRNQGKLGNDLNQFISNIKVRQSRSLDNVDKIFNESNVDYVASDKINLNEFKRLSGGTTRDVYDLGKVVIKVAKSPKGIEQNQSLGFGDAQMLAPFIPEQYEKGLDYIVMENVPRNDKAVNEFLKPLREFTQQDFDMKTPELQEVLYEKGLDDFMSYSLLWNDFTAKRNWGQRANGDFVLVDEGALNPNVTSISKPSAYAVQDWQKVKNLRKTNNIKQSRNLNYHQNYQNNLHTSLLNYVKRHVDDTLPARTWLNKLFGNTELTVADLKWMGIYNQMMQKRKKLTREDVFNIIAKTKYKTFDLDPQSNVKNLIVTTEFEDQVNTISDQSFTKFPIVSEIETKMIKNGSYEIMLINNIKGNEEVALKQLIQKSNYDDIFAIAHKNKQILNSFKTKFDFGSIVDDVTIAGQKFGLLIISPKLKGISNSDFGFRMSKDLPQGFAESEASSIFNQDYIRAALQDKHIYLKRLYDYAAKEGFTVKDDSNAYVKENLAKGKIQFKTDNFHETLFTPLMKHVNSIIKKGRVEYKEISDYVYALHAKERRILKIDPGITVEQQDQYIDSFESKVGIRDRNILVDRIKDIVKFNVKESFYYGLISKENFDKFYPKDKKDKKAMFDFYVPLRGFEKSEFDNTAFSYINMKAKGRGGMKADDPLAYLYIMGQSTIIQGEKNNSKRALLNFVREFPAPELYEVKQTYYDMSSDNVINEITEKPKSDYKTSLSPFETLEEKTVRKFENKAHDLIVYENGRKKIITFNNSAGERIVKGFSSGPRLTNDYLSKAYAFMEYTTNFMRSVFTQYNPAFIPVNFVRDVTAGLININTDFGTKVTADVLKDIIKSGSTLRKYYASGQKVFPKGKDGDLLKLYIENGSRTGYSSLKTVDEVKKELEEFTKDVTKVDPQFEVKKIVTGVTDVLDSWNGSIENTVRFAAFKKLLDMGKSLDEASIYAKDLTVNFNRKGSIGNALNTYFLFFNAGIQGVERLVRPIVNKETRGRAIRNYVGVLPVIGFLFQTLARYGAGEDEEQGISYYDLLPEYTRERFIVLPNPELIYKSDEEIKKMNTRDRFITIPLPYGHNVFFAVPDIITRYMLNIRNNPNEIGVSSLGLVTESFSPLGPITFEGDSETSSQLVKYIAPSFVKPLAEYAFNVNFMGGKIYKEDSQYAKSKTPNSQLYFDSVSPTLKNITTYLNKVTGGDTVKPGLIDINPELPEFLLQSYGGGVYSFANNVYNFATMLFDQNRERKKSDLIIGDINLGEMRKIPIFRRFVTEVSPYATYTEYFRYRDMIEVVADQDRKYKNNIKDGVETRENYLKFKNDPENKSLLSLVTRLKATEKKRKSLVERRNVLRGKGEDKKADQIQLQINKELKKFNKFVNVKELRTLDDIMSFIQD